MKNAVKKARLSALQSLLNEQQKNYNKSFVNKEVEVLFERFLSKERDEPPDIDVDFENDKIIVAMHCENVHEDQMASKDPQINMVQKMM